MLRKKTLLSMHSCAVCVVLFLLLAVNSNQFRILCSYTSRPFMYAPCLYPVCVYMYYFSTGSKFWILHSYTLLLKSPVLMRSWFMYRTSLSKQLTADIYHGTHTMHSNWACHCLLWPWAWWWQHRKPNFTVPSSLSLPTN